MESNEDKKETNEITSKKTTMDPELIKKGNVVVKFMNASPEVQKRATRILAMRQKNEMLNNNNQQNNELSNNI